MCVCVCVCVAHSVPGCLSERKSERGSESERGRESRWLKGEFFRLFDVCISLARDAKRNSNTIISP